MGSNERAVLVEPQRLGALVAPHVGGFGEEVGHPAKFVNLNEWGRIFSLTSTQGRKRNRK